MKRFIHLVEGFLVAVFFMTCHPPALSADVSAGDVIDKTNWQKVEGLLPDPVLNWLKKGDGPITVGELPYNPAEYYPPEALESLKSNVGKYGVDEKGLLMDMETGKLPVFVSGMPFPTVDQGDPKAGAKLMYNKHYYSYVVGNIVVPFQVKWIGRGSGFEREVIFDYWTYARDGYPPARETPNREGIELYSIIRALAPFDIKGTNILLWRYRDERQDSTFAYVPAIRRVRRMSPANRSDAFVGTDFCVDDAWGYAGKIMAFDWRVVRKAEQLIPFYPGVPVPVLQNEDGQWAVDNQDRKVRYGFEVEGFQGAPWWPTSFIFVMRPTYILECKSKDPYYNYGTQYLWVDAEFFTPSYKVIHDRSGAYWKVEWQAMIAIETPDRKFRTIGLANMMGFDDRSDHASNLVLTDPDNHTQYFVPMDENDYSLGGFQKLCK